LNDVVSSEHGGAKPEAASSPWVIERVPELSGFTVEWADSTGYLLSRGSTLYAASRPLPPFVELGRPPGLSTPLRLAARFQVSRRALRLLYYNVVRLDEDRVFATFNREPIIVTPDGSVRVGGFDRSFRVLRNACGVGADGSVWFGEYVIESGPTALRIYRLRPGQDRAEVVEVLPPGFARHVHGVYVDPFDQSIWCLTGDTPEESKVLRCAHGSSTFEPVGEGDKSWCAVSLQFRADGIYYASDAPFRENWIHRIDRDSHERVPVALLDGPVYYSHRVGDDLFFAVTAETGPGGRNGLVTLWHLDADCRCSLVTSFRKDRWPIGGFLPGTLSFPGGSGVGGSFYFSGVGLAGFPGTTFRCTRAGQTAGGGQTKVQ